MLITTETTCTAFEGSRRIASGALGDVALKCKEVVDRGAQVLIFNDATSEQVELDLRGTCDDLLKRLERTTDGPRRPGRPRLGVIAREVTLLPRHWDWLNRQSGGASVALRKLVDQARHANQDNDRIRESQERTYRFMAAMAGNLPGFEEAARALFAADRERFDREVAAWPPDIREHARTLAQAIFCQPAPLR